MKKPKKINNMWAPRAKLEASAGHILPAGRTFCCLSQAGKVNLFNFFHLSALSVRNQPTRKVSTKPDKRQLKIHEHQPSNLVGAKPP